MVVAVGPAITIEKSSTRSPTRGPLASPVIGIASLHRRFKYRMFSGV